MSQIKKAITKMKWSGILIAVLAIAIGVLFLVLPKESADVLCTVSGIALLCAGVVAVVTFILYGFAFSAHSLIIGIALLLSGAFCLINPSMVKELLTVIFGLFIVIDGSTSLVDSIDCARAHIKGWGFMLLLSILTVALGILVMFDTFDTVMMFAGISLIIDGICDIIFTCVFSRRIREAKKRIHELYFE